MTATIPVGAGPSDVAGQPRGRSGWPTPPRARCRASTRPPTRSPAAPAVGRNPVRLAAGFGSVWVANETSQTVSRLDARTGQLQATIPVTGRMSRRTSWPSAPAWSGSSSGVPAAVRLDPATNTDDPTYRRLGDRRRRAGGGRRAAVALWARPAPAPARSSGWTRRPAGSSTGSRPAGTARSLSVVAASGLAGITTQTIYRYDPTSRQLLAEIPIGVVAKPPDRRMPVRCG